MCIQIADHDIDYSFCYFLLIHQFDLYWYIALTDLSCYTYAHINGHTKHDKYVSRYYVLCAHEMVIVCVHVCVHVCVCVCVWVCVCK